MIIRNAIIIVHPDHPIIDDLNADGKPELSDSMLISGKWTDETVNLILSLLRSLGQAPELVKTDDLG